MNGAAVREVAVTGIGLVTPAGIGTEATWAGLLAGTPTAAKDPDLAGLPVDFACRVPGYDAEALLGRRLTWRLDPFATMALVAAREAVADAGLGAGDWEPSRVGVVLGIGCVSMTHYMAEFAKIATRQYDSVSPVLLPRCLPNMVAGEVALDLKAHGPAFTVSTACASGTSALGIARDLIRSGTCDIVITGGSESVRQTVPAVCFARMGALSRRTDAPEAASRPFDADRDGFVLGEGAGILVLERPAHARGRGVRPRAYLSGYGATCDAHHFTSPHPEGRGAAEAMRAALADAGMEPADIDHVNAHGTGTPRNDIAESRALTRVFRSPPPVTSLKGVTGHAIGGAGGIEAAGAVLSLQHQTIPPTANLDALDPEIDLDVVAKAPRSAALRAVVSSSFGFGGQNAAVVITAA
ncbi:beta-ketoacyl-[acyl-carrier-protein] synthase family protein [Streptomyces sp. NPDC045431]|uniref:beta-ketoacyl-[acyl-carrier-protein] synthase family protein n=1 Tax=Streptomyces sp. NPDC045431 TaxID=3155613 RepID=UPI003404E101